MKKIEAVKKIDDEIEEAKQRKREKEEQIRARAKSDQDYVAKETQKVNAGQTYARVFDDEGRREPNLAAYTIWYWFGLMLIGCAEWLINYDTFFMFMGVPAIAVGATLILGVLLAFAAHGHGTILKQWTHRFGPQVRPNERWSNWRFFGLATFSVLVVLIAAGGSRYGAAMHSLSNQPQVNILGAQAMIDVNPFRDVLLSLLANVAAWAVGVYLAYLCHDKNPEFMSATHYFRKADRAFRRAHKKYGDELQSIEAALEEDIKKKRENARSNSADVAQEQDLLNQIRSHERTLTNAIKGVVERNLEAYRGALIVTPEVQKGQNKLIYGDKQLTAFDYRALKLTFSDHFAS